MSDFENKYQDCPRCQETRERCALVTAGAVVLTAVVAGMTGIVLGAAAVEPEVLVETKYVLLKDNTA